ncbi:hypothetical protein BBD42_08690 [Paenibacillus sp. BIHB 4019]|uniref:Uncharacterized protein n=1 Tax=Paenibacillus sp. BIHB 4019 TaxID=1870819 RepID=A0A1B2DFN8_9BACL|nr:hypothetical protein BBD42_08690 [Paenibacillus sp. BIHB 4019]
MGLLYNKKSQIIVTLLYPIVVFVILSIKQTLETWIIPVLVTVLFCILWSNVWYLITSTLLMWVISVPMWLLLIEQSKGDQGYAIFTSSLPFIIALFIFVVLIPEILIIIFKNFILNKYFYQKS